MGKPISARGRKEDEIMTLGLTPWKRRGEIGPFWKQMEDAWNRFFTEMTPTEHAWRWMPSVDISETDGSVTVRAELPGMDVKDIDIDISGDVLTLKGEKKTEQEKKEEDYYCHESYAGSFNRSFRLPTGVQSDKADAKFKNGVLTIDIPKSEESKGKKIKIKTS